MTFKVVQNKGEYSDENDKARARHSYLMPVDWGEVEKAAEKDRGRIYGKYTLSNDDKEQLIKLLKKNDGSVVLSLEMVKQVFGYEGSAQGAAIVSGLNRTFGDDFKAGTRAGGDKIVITLKS